MNKKFAVLPQVKYMYYNRILLMCIYIHAIARATSRVNWMQIDFRVCPDLSSKKFCVSISLYTHNL